MFRQLCEELYLKFQAALSGVLTAGLSPAKVLGLYLAVIREYAYLLRQTATKSSFSTDEEIWFFKYLKPKFVAEKIFRMEVYAIEMQRPVGTSETLRAYFEEELHIVQRFFRQHSHFYHYFRAEFSECDQLYFLRGADVSTLLLPEPQDHDPDFSTGMDSLFARFIAFERLQQYLLELIANPFPSPMAFDLHERRKKTRLLRWTGDTINLVEVGFSLYDTAQLNDSKATLTEIFEWIEDNLQVNIGKPHRRFDEIESRKRISKTDYIDRMRDAILGRIDRKNAYDPEKEEQLRQRAERRRKAAEKKAADEKETKDKERKSSDENHQL